MIMNRNCSRTEFRIRALLCVLLFITAGVAVIFATGSGELESRNAFGIANGSSKIAPWVIEHTANGEKAQVFVVLPDQADLRRAANLPTKAEKGRYVFDALRSKSEATQGSILRWLRERGIEHRSFYIVNAILIKGTREVAEALASRQDVARIEGNPHLQNALPEPASSLADSSRPQGPEAVEPNIAYTHAPDVWALGFRGQGITVGVADTGQR